MCQISEIQTNKTSKSCGESKHILFKEIDKSDRMVEIEFRNNTIVDCFLYGDKQIADKVIINKLCKPKQQYINKQDMSQWVLKCSQWLSGLITKGIVPTYGDHRYYL